MWGRRASSAFYPIRPFQHTRIPRGVPITMSDETKRRRPGRYGQDEIERNRLEPWPNPRPTREYVIHFEIPEFTCLCPRSGFPDFATIVIDYVPGPSVLELKSLKLYINGFRDRA